MNVINSISEMENVSCTIYTTKHKNNYCSAANKINIKRVATKHQKAVLRSGCFFKFNILTALLSFGFDIDESVLNLAINKEEIHKVCFIGNPDVFRAKLTQSIANKGIEIDVFGHG